LHSSSDLLTSLAKKGARLIICLFIDAEPNPIRPASPGLLHDKVFVRAGVTTKPRSKAAGSLRELSPRGFPLPTHN
jgi:hypothetical protein